MNKKQMRPIRSRIWSRKLFRAMARRLPMLKQLIKYISIGLSIFIKHKNKKKNNIKLCRAFYDP